MIKNNQFWALALVILLISSEWGAKCEAEKMAFDAEVGRYLSLHSDSWISSSTLFTHKKKSS